MVELSTLGAIIKVAYEGQSDTNAFTDAEKTKLAGLATVATSGAYSDLSDLPSLFSGNFSDLTGTPAFIEESRIGANNGVAPLDASGLVPLQHLNVSGLSFKGAWDPNTNTPTLVDGTGSTGDFYKASHAGTFNTGNGTHTYAIGDWIIFAGGIWNRLGSADTVSMVNGMLGNVVLTAEHVGAVASVNGKTGQAITLNAAEVGTLPSTYTPPANPATTWAQVSGKPDLVNSVNGQSGNVVIAPPSRTLSYSNQLPNRVANTWYPAGANDRIVHILTNYAMSTPSSNLQMRRIGTTAPTFGVKSTAIDAVNNNQAVQATVPAGWEYRFVPGGTRTVSEWFEGVYS